MKKLTLLVVMLCSFTAFSQSQHFCKKAVQTSINSWSYRVFQSNYPMMGFVQINVTTYSMWAPPSSTVWQPFISRGTYGGVGYGSSCVIEIRIGNEFSGITSQFVVQNTCS